MESKYLNAFKAAQGKESTLTSEVFRVERLEIGEAKTSSGIILAKDNRQANGVYMNPPVYVVILEVGAGYVNAETGETEQPNGYAPGQVVLVGPEAVQWYSTLPFPGYIPNTIGLVAYNQILEQYESLDAFKAKWKALGDSLNPAQHSLPGSVL